MFRLYVAEWICEGVSFTRLRGRYISKNSARSMFVQYKYNTMLFDIALVQAPRRAFPNRNMWALTGSKTVTNTSHTQA